MSHQMDMDELIEFADLKRRAAEDARAAGRSSLARELMALAQRAERMAQIAAERYFVQAP